MWDVRDLIMLYSVVPSSQDVLEQGVKDLCSSQNLHFGKCSSLLLQILHRSAAHSQVCSGP